jgi:hypothetical protein
MMHLFDPLDASKSHAINVHFEAFSLHVIAYILWQFERSQ